MKIKPVRDRILVKRLEEEEKTAGGIIIPDSAKEKPQLGIVVEVGTGKVLENGKVLKPDVKKGDKVVFPRYAGTEIKLGGEPHLLMSEDEVMGVVEEAGAEEKPRKK
jgi:chaperonin GroES